MPPLVGSCSLAFGHRGRILQIQYLSFLEPVPQQQLVCMVILCSADSETQVGQSNLTTELRMNDRELECGRVTSHCWGCSLMFIDMLHAIQSSTDMLDLIRSSDLPSFRAYQTKHCRGNDRRLGSARGIRSKAQDSVESPFRQMLLDGPSNRSLSPLSQQSHKSGTECHEEERRQNHSYRSSLHCVAKHELMRHELH